MTQGLEARLSQVLTLPAGSGGPRAGFSLTRIKARKPLFQAMRMANGPDGREDIWVGNPARLQLTCGLDRPSG